jgi:hypothetical protein
MTSPGTPCPGLTSGKMEGGPPRSTLHLHRRAPGRATQAGADATILTRAGNDPTAYLDRGGFLPAQFAYAVVADAPDGSQVPREALITEVPHSLGVPSVGDRGHPCHALGAVPGSLAAGGIGSEGAPGERQSGPIPASTPPATPSWLMASRDDRLESRVRPGANGAPRAMHYPRGAPASLRGSLPYLASHLNEGVEGTRCQVKLISDF